MAKIYRLAFVFFVGCCLISGSSLYAHSTGARSGSVQNKHSKEFASDTILIHKYIKLASDNLYYDANKAVLYAQQTLRLSQKHQWAKGKIIAYDLLSTYYLIDGSYDILRQISNEILILSQKENMPLYTANAKRFLGETSAEFKQFDASLANFQSAIKIYTELKQDSAKAVCLENLGNFYREKLGISAGIEIL